MTDHNKKRGPVYHINYAFSTPHQLDNSIIKRGLLTRKRMQLSKVKKVISRATKQNPSCPIKHHHHKHLCIRSYRHLYQKSRKPHKTITIISKIQNPKLHTILSKSWETKLRVYIYCDIHTSTQTHIDNTYKDTKESFRS